VIELKNLVRIVRQIVGVELSQRSLKTGASTVENVAPATFAASLPLSLQSPDLVACRQWY